MVKIEEGKPYQTKDGCRWAGYSYYAGGEYPVHGAWQDPHSQRWYISAWTKDGKNCETQKLDLVPAPREFARERWINVYEWEEVLFGSKYAANYAASNKSEKRLACVRVMIQCHEGDGLEPEEN